MIYEFAQAEVQPIDFRRPAGLRTRLREMLLLRVSSVHHSDPLRTYATIDDMG